MVNLGTVTNNSVHIIMHCIVIVLLGLACLYGASSFKEEDDVLVLTDDTFDCVLAEFPYLLVFFCTFVNFLGTYKICCFCFFGVLNEFSAIN